MSPFAACCRRTFFVAVDFGFWQSASHNSIVVVLIDPNLRAPEISNELKMSNAEQCCDPTMFEEMTENRVGDPDGLRPKTLCKGGASCTPSRTGVKRHTGSVCRSSGRSRDFFDQSIYIYIYNI